MTRRRYIGWAGLFLGLTLIGGCGKNLDAGLSASQDGIPVTGVGGFGTQCSLEGTRGDPLPVTLTSYGCATSSGGLKLQQPLLPVILQADCLNKEVLAYSIDGTRIENRWDALPDGRFYFTMDAGNISLKNDHEGHTGCQTPATLAVAGLMKCRDRDHATLEIDATWTLNQTVPGTEVHLTEPGCSIPQGCIFHTFTTLKQCGG